MERFFYELECIKGTWSVRELRRQIDTKLYFRSGISKKSSKCSYFKDNCKKVQQPLISHIHHRFNQLFLMALQRVLFRDFSVFHANDGLATV